MCWKIKRSVGLCLKLTGAKMNAKNLGLKQNAKRKEVMSSKNQSSNYLITMFSEAYHKLGHFHFQAHAWTISFQGHGTIHFHFR